MIPRPFRTLTRSNLALSTLSGLALLALSSHGRAQVHVDWVANTRGVAIAVDGADNTFTADYEYALGAEISVTKRDVDGALLWVASIDQTEATKWERAEWLAVDGQGGVLVCGTLMSGYSNPVEAASLLLKFAADGTPLFRTVYESGFDGSSTRRLLVDEFDNAYVVGMGIGPAGMVAKVKKFAPDGSALWSWFDSRGIGRPTQAKFSRDGDLLISARSIFGSLNGYARVDRQGAEVWGLAGVPSLAAGDAAGDAFGQTYVVHGQFGANGGTVVRKLDGQGALLWERVYPSAGFRIEVGPDQQPVISGFPTTGSAGAAFFKLDAAGTLLWSNLDADGPLALLQHAQMLVDASGAAYLAAGTLFEMAVCKVRSDGASAWTATMPGSAAASIALGRAVGSVFVTGGRTARLFENVPEIGNSYCVGAANSVGGGARIKSFGSRVVADNDVLLTVSGLPANRSGIFILGLTPMQLPFGDGFRCVGGPLLRVPPVLSSGPYGALQHALDLGSPPAAGVVLPGLSAYFQFWYRDPQGPGGSGFNLSDGREVSFL